MYNIHAQSGIYLPNSTKVKKRRGSSSGSIDAKVKNVKTQQSVVDKVKEAFLRFYLMKPLKQLYIKP